MDVLFGESETYPAGSDLSHCPNAAICSCSLSNFTLNWKRLLLRRIDMQYCFLLARDNMCFGHLLSQFSVYVTFPPWRWEAIHFSETVRFYQATRRHFPYYHNLYRHRGSSLKIDNFFVTAIVIDHSISSIFTGAVYQGIFLAKILLAFPVFVILGAWVSHRNLLHFTILTGVGDLLKPRSFWLCNTHPGQPIVTLHTILTTWSPSS